MKTLPFGTLRRPGTTLPLLLLLTIPAFGYLLKPPSVADLLESVYQQTDHSQNGFANHERVALFESRLQSETRLGPRLVGRFLVARERLRDGESEAALGELESIRDTIQSRGTKQEIESWMPQLNRLILASSLRLGEQENCIAQHCGESCVFPLRGTAVHSATRGSKKAIAELGKRLRQNPDSLAYRWLLNLAHMTLGEYPEAVPEALLIPPAVFESEHDIGEFGNVAGPAGLAEIGLAGGCVLDDLDGDGDLDVMTSSWGVRDPMHLYRQDAGRFVELGGEGGLEGLRGGLNLVQADYDNDGDIDVLVLRGAWLKEQGKYPNSLLRNRGDGTFEDVTVDAGLLSYHPTQTAAWGDIDGDGWLDLFVGNESRPGSRHPCELYYNNGDGTFKEVSHYVGIDEVGFVKGVAWGDVDNDGRPDLYLSKFGERNVLYRNDGPRAMPNGEPGWGFTDVTVQAGVAEPVKSFPIWFWDYDNDGWNDLFVGTYTTFQGMSLDVIVADYLGRPHGAETSRLYRNRGDGTFEDVSKAVGLDHPMMAMGANFGDLDNDGFLDCYIGTGQPNLLSLVPNRMYRNDAGRRFQNVTTSGRFGHIQKGHGIAFGDIDHDGDQDVLAVMGGAYSGDVFANALFENPGHGGHWVSLQLVGTRSNRCAIGARIRLVVEGAQGPREIHRTVGSGGSFGASPLRQHIGIGAATTVRTLEVSWPGGATQTHQNLEGDSHWVVREGDARPRRGTLTRVTLGGS